MQWLLYGEIISILSVCRSYSGNGDDQCVQVCEAEQKLWVGPATDSTPGKKNGSVCLREKRLSSYASDSRSSYASSSGLRLRSRSFMLGKRMQKQGRNSAKLG